MKRFFFLVILLLPVSLINVSPVHASNTMIYVDPPSIIDTSKLPQATFTINIGVKDVTDLYTFVFNLDYSATVLNITSSKVGSFFGEEKKDSFIWKNVTDFASGHLRFHVGLPMGTPKGQGKSGSGTLMKLTFTVLSQGHTNLDLSDTKLWDSYASTITHTAYDGYFSNIPLPQLSVQPDGEGIIDPSLVPGKNFAIEVSVSNAEDLYGCKFKLEYNTALLDAVSISEGDFLKGSGSTIFSSKTNETEGFVQINITRVGPIGGATGNGILAKITFNITAVGESILRLYDTELINPEGTAIEHAPGVNGYFSNKPLIHDVAITKVETIVTTWVSSGNVTAPVDKRVSNVQVGDHLNVTVTVKNNGTVAETFDVTAYCNSTAIGTINGIALDEGASTTLTFTWDTEKMAAGDYTIWAEASTITEETNTVNNRFTMENKFTVSPPNQTIPTELIIVGAVVAALAVATPVYFLKIRRPKTPRTES